MAQLDLVFTQGGGCRVEVRQPVAAEMESRRATWLAMSTRRRRADRHRWMPPTRARTPRPWEAVTPPPPPRRQTRPSSRCGRLYQRRGGIAELDADDQSILYTPLFTYAANPDANKTISFGNYLAALYAEIVTNDPATGLPEGASASRRSRAV